MSRGSAGLRGQHLVGPKDSQASSVGELPGSGATLPGAHDSPALTDHPTLAQTAQAAWRRWRNRLLAQPRFRHWAAGFWPTRARARREAAQLFDLVAGFAYSQVLLACVRSGLLRALAERPLDAPTLARHCALPLPGMQRLLEAAAALRLVERDGALWTCGPLGIVLATEPAIEAMVLHHEALYEDLRDPLALLRATPGAPDAPGVQPTGLRRYWPYAGMAPARGLVDDQVAPYSLLMSASQPLVAAQVLDAVDLRGHRCLMDVGGGEGGFLAAVAERHPHMRLVLLDLPAVARRADRALRAKGLVARTVGADFRIDRLPVGADLVSLVRVLHDHDDAVVLDLLGRVHAALGPGGRLLVAEPLADTPGAQAMGDAYFGMYLWAMGAGRPRSAARLAEMLRACGFSQVRQLPTRQPLQCGLLSAWV